MKLTEKTIKEIDETKEQENLIGFVSNSGLADEMHPEREKKEMQKKPKEVKKKKQEKELKTWSL